MKFHDALQFSQSTQKGLDFLANHDIKAIAYALLVEEGHLTTTGLANVVAERAGINKLQAPVTYPDTYVQAGFAVIEQGLPHKGVPRRLFRATQLGAGLAATGAMLDWSESHDISLITALSATASKGSRAPVNTIQLLHGMLAGVNVGQITDTRYKKTEQGWSTNHNARLQTMLSDGLVVAVDDEPSFKILEPEYKGSKPFDLLHANQQHVYTTLSTAKQSESTSRRKWTITEIENLAESINPFGSPDEKQDFHKRLVRVISAGNPRYSPNVTEKVEMSGRRYSIAPHFQDPAADLVERAIQIDAAPSKQREFRDRAVAQALDEQAVRRIVMRGVQASPFINAKR